MTNDERIEAMIRRVAELGRKSKARYTTVGSKQFDTMPGHWPFPAELTMGDVRAAMEYIESRTNSEGERK